MHDVNVFGTHAAAAKKRFVSGAKHSPPAPLSGGPEGQNPRFQHFV